MLRCGDEVGEVGSHDYIEATCTTPKTCRYCNEVVGTANGHNYERKTKKLLVKKPVQFMMNVAYVKMFK